MAQSSPATGKLAALSLSALILYFAVHTFAGEQGLGNWSDMQREVADLEAELEAVQAEIAALERDIARLTPGSIDRDFVESLAREKLAFVHPDEIILKN
ncbi:MAG: septum formation initiator family protein [Pseudomonadota bacterium]